MRTIAFLAVQDGEAWLEGCVAALRREGLGVYVIDNASSDATPRILAGMRDAGLLEGLEALPDQDGFSLAACLAAKERAMHALAPDWVLHADVDEMHHPRDERTLREAMADAEREGYDVLNFEEYVFLPLGGRLRFDASPFPDLDHCYLHAPKPLRLQRAWRWWPGRSNVAAAGHEVLGPARIAPEPLVLRHYPFLDQAHALEKYAQRRFARDGLARGWHRNRIGVPIERFMFPPTHALDHLADPSARALPCLEPRLSHYWAWDSGPAADSQASTAAST